MTYREEIRSRLAINVDIAERVLTQFVQDAIQTTATQGVVVGLSGGVDSALAATLATRALGTDKVHPFFLPYRTSNASSAEDAQTVANDLGLDLQTIDISRMVDAYFERYEEKADRVRMGNKMARERMSILYDQAKKLSCLVLGTSNKTEILLGYSTIFGDNASSINPLGDLYKQQVWELSRYLGIADKVVNKKPTADLWPGQTDEGELGLDYATADEVLYLMFDQSLSPDEIIKRGYPAEAVNRITQLEQQYRFKRRLMLIARLSDSAINLDREIPRD